MPGEQRSHPNLLVGLFAGTGIDAGKHADQVAFAQRGVDAADQTRMVGAPDHGAGFEQGDELGLHALTFGTGGRDQSVPNKSVETCGASRAEQQIPPQRGVARPTRRTIPPERPGEALD